MVPRSIFKNYSGFLNLVSRIMDPIMIVAAAYFAYGMRFTFSNLNLNKDYVTLIVFGVLAVLSIFPLFQLYSSWRGQTLWKQAQTVFLAWGVVLLILIALLFGLKISAVYSRVWLVYWAIYGLLFILLLRLVIYSLLQYQRRKGKNVRYVVIAGAGDLAKKVVSQMMGSSWTGYQILALFDDNESLSGKDIQGIPVKGRIDDIINYINICKGQVDEIWIALPLRAEQRMKSLLFELRHFTVNIKLIPDIFGFSLLNHSLTEVAGLPAVNLSDTPMGGVNKLIKGLEDRVLGFIIFILIIPVAIVIAAGIKLSSPGPILFKQKRHGWDGKIINVYKFRTMKIHAEENGAVTQARANDSRITPFGTFLRRTSLDELPQFYNVLQGRMSIVGPRPHAIQHNEEYKEKVDKYMLRHMVKPGITGWAQVNGYRGETDTLDKMKKRIEYDLYYIENWSLWFDIKIILLTIFKGFIHKNAY